MECPKCKCGRCAYMQKRTRHTTEDNKFKRTDFNAKCPECGWEGELR